MVHGQSEDVGQNIQDQQVLQKDQSNIGMDEHGEEFHDEHTRAK